MTKKILVIDDDEAIRKSFFLALEDSEYLIETASSGEQGIEKHREHSFDLIFLDLKMPGINGAETLMRLRRIDKEVPIYFITAFYTEYFEELRNAEKDGIAFEVLRKPIDANQILMVTEGMLKGPVSY